jgi:hypothetical protein
VTAQGGTATKKLRDLRDSLNAEFGSRGYDVLLFGKTGTATVKVFAPGDVGRVARELYARAGIYFDGRRVTLTAQGQRFLAGTGFLALFSDLVDDMNDDLVAYTVGPAHTERAALFVIDEGRLRVNAMGRDMRHTIKTKGAMFLLTVVLAPTARARHAADVPACLPSQTVGELMAVPPASELLPTESVGLTVAAYIEDTHKLADEVAARFVNEIRDELKVALSGQLAKRQ